MRRGPRYVKYMALRATGMPADQAAKIVRAWFVLRFGR
jgi:hypothetical protein